MATNVIMPALDVGQEKGKVLEWLKAEGQAVAQGEVLMVVETDKASVEIEAPATGTLSQVTAPAGTEVPVGQVIAKILAPGESPSGSTAKPPASPSLATTLAAPTSALPQADTAVSDAVSASPLARRIAAENNVDLSQVKPSGERIEKADVLAYIDAQKQVKPESSTKATGRVAASPKARHFASEHGIDLNAIPGSGPEGAVLYADAVAFAADKEKLRPTPPQPAPAPVTQEEIITPGTIWRIMAERTTHSWTSAPHFYLMREVNASRLVTWRERAQKRFGQKITYTDLLVRLVAAALREHPRVNATWLDGHILIHKAINIGLAAAVEDGLVVPIIHKADGLSVAEIAEQRAALLERAKAGRLRPEDINGGTFTISNLGMYGIDIFNAIVNPPQAAILAIGRITPRVVPVDERPAVQPMMTLSLSCDHRAIDGARAAQYVQTLAEMIEEPLGLLD